MDSSDIKFNEKLKMTFKIGQQKNSVILVLSDFLKASKQELQPAYKKNIAEFLSSSKIWYPACLERIRSEASKSGDIELMQAYILSEQNAEPLLFGLSYRVEFDIEHGRGFKVDGSTYKIIEYGEADTAFT